MGISGFSKVFQLTSYVNLSKLLFNLIILLLNNNNSGILVGIKQTSVWKVLTHIRHSVKGS